MKKPLVLATSLLVLLGASTANAAIVNLTATMSGNQEVPPVATIATGSATLQFDDVTKMLSGTVTLVNITNVNNQHIHSGACGVAGGVAVGIPAPSGNTITIPATNMAANETALLTGGLYINIHTSNAGGANGEIRGQIRMGGTVNNCPPSTSDGGTDASTSSSSSGGSTSSGGSSSGVTTTPTDGGGNTSTSSGASGTSSGSSDDGGCNSSGTDAESGLAILGLGFAFAVAARFRRRR